MASLFDRLFIDSNDYDKIPCHIFYAALVDLASGHSTKVQLINAFNMNDEQINQLNMLEEAYGNSTNKNQWLQELHSVMMLAEWDLKYNTPSSFATRMGL